jgi:hypothetical protein
MRNIVFDLENTIIWGTGARVIHPQAQIVLARARQDFTTVNLWSLCQIKDVVSTLAELDLFKFDRIIASEFDDMGSTTIFSYTGEQETGKRRTKLAFKKDLRILGNPKEYVLIENKPTYGLPRERVIEVELFQGQPDHDLLGAYEQALRKF